MVVINRDDPAVMRLLPAPETVAERARAGRARRAAPRRRASALDAPSAPGDFGLVDENGMAWLVRARERRRRRADDEP